MDWLTDPSTWIGLLTLTVLEIVLGVDNIIFISILAGKLPEGQRAKARRLGLLGAFFSRLLLLLSIAWGVRLTTPLFSGLGVDGSGRGLILIAGRSLVAVVAQIMVVDIVFSLDSVITAVGMVDQVSIMIAANVIALGIMMF